MSEELDIRQLNEEMLSVGEPRGYESQQYADVDVDRPRRRVWPWVLAVILVLVVSLGMIVVAGALGYRDGMLDREDYLRVQALEHYRLGVQHMETKEYELALAEFEEALRFEPGLQSAWEKLRETQVRLVTVPTPTSVPLPTPSPSPSPTPTETHPDKAEVLADAQAFYEEGAYLEAVARIEQLLASDPRYEEERVEELLFQCYWQQAQVWIGEDRLEEAVRLLDLALQIRPDDHDVYLERELATKYMEALGYWGANWTEASVRFGELHQLRPDYKDTSSRLLDAYVAQGDLLSEGGQWCEAAEFYKKALQLRSDQALADKREQMVQNCALNLPPPTAEGPPATETVPENPEGTPAAASTPPGSAEAQEPDFDGTLYYALFDAELRQYVLYRIHANGSDNVQVILGMHQPQVDQGGKYLVARAQSNVNTLGLYLIDLASGDPPAVSIITSHLDDLYASFSPNGKQIVFTSNRMSERLWTLFTAWVDRQSEPRAVVQGQTPAWSPQGDRFVYKGCDQSGNNCGLYTVSPDGTAVQRVVNDPSAGFADWSPDGQQLAFMSNRDGNWEIYGVGADGQGLRRITRSKSSEGLPAWSPDGTAIAFVSDRDGQWGIYLQRLDDGLPTKLVTLDTTYEDWLIEKIAWGPTLEAPSSP